MTRAFLILGGSLVASWGLLAFPVSFVDGKEFVARVAGYAALMCGIPAVLACLLVASVRHRPAMDRMAAIFLSIFVRMGLTVGSGVALFARNDDVRAHASAFIGWGLGFYLITLVVESVLVSGDLSGPATDSAPPNGMNGSNYGHGNDTGSKDRSV